MSTPRYAFAAVALNGSIYAIGGANASTFGLNSVEMYNPSSNTWTAVAPLLTGRANFGATSAGGLIYVMGGLDGNFNQLNTVEVYNPATNSWSTAATMPTTRYNLAAASVNGLVYALGGYNNSLGVYSVVEVYSPSTNTWSEAPGMPTAREYLGADGLNGQIYAIGGEGFNGSLSNPTYLKTVEVFNPTTSSWTTYAPMLSARYELAVADAGGLLYAIDGVDGDSEQLGNYMNSAEEYQQAITFYFYQKN
jgi:N-acetylneuraminic acid mutarotase